MNGQTLPYFTFAIQVAAFLIVGLLFPILTTMNRRRMDAANRLEEKIEDLRTETLAGHLGLRTSLHEHTRWHMSTKKDE